MRNTPRRSLRQNARWTLASNISYAACQWGVIVCLAKLGSPEIVGRFGLGLAIASPVIVLTQLQLRSVLVTDSKQAFRFGEYLALRLILTMVALAAIAGLAWMEGYVAASAFTPRLYGCDRHCWILPLPQVSNQSRPSSFAPAARSTTTNRRRS
jgi:O-antigen/teichoic acid export membrane protein